MKNTGKPPVARSPIRARTRQALKPINGISPLRVSTAAKTKPEIKESKTTDLSKLVQEELCAMNAKNYPSFEKGEFYDEYIARRNERLRKKQNKIELDEPKTAYSLGVKVESSAMKKNTTKKTESVKKSVTAAIYGTVDRSQHPRYSLRSSVKKPPLMPVPVPMNVDVEMTATRKNATVSRSRRK